MEEELREGRGPSVQLQVAAGSLPQQSLKASCEWFPVKMALSDMFNSVERTNCFLLALFSKAGAYCFHKNKCSQK